MLITSVEFRDRSAPGRVSDCPQRKHLCENKLYYDLMTAECLKTCGRCPREKKENKAGGSGDCVDRYASLRTAVFEVPTSVTNLWTSFLCSHLSTNLCSIVSYGTSLSSDQTNASRRKTRHPPDLPSSDQEGAALDGSSEDDQKKPRALHLSS
ncbi:hypothetical protein QR680_004450 [Steinernema hermaphroditum]|uniref:ShKT domain-containing protein n=1 Tax=Steinernema hermaphroditum TaxID=289476 RepID=A0AA39HPS4_9BILA|nr:hypothetical protein QR680_004450 [Steinernema hermaphroditum]